MENRSDSRLVNALVSSLADLRTSTIASGTRHAMQNAMTKGMFGQLLTRMDVDFLKYFLTCVQATFDSDGQTIANRAPPDICPGPVPGTHMACQVCFRRCVQS